MSFFEELKRRNVVRVGIAYAVAAWLLLQLTEVLTELLELPTSLGKIVIALLLIGFPVALIFAWAFELTPDGVKREKDVQRHESISPHTGKKLDRIIIVGLVLVIVGLGIERVWFAGQPADLPVVAGLAHEEPTVTSVQEATAATATAHQESVAVLPFTAMSSGEDDEYFADGLTEEILNYLAGLPELLVTARTSSFHFKGKDLPIPEIARTLGVNHVVEGSVRRAGERVRITAQLIRAEDGFHLWSDTYDRTLEDVFAVQEDIAANIAETLDVVLDEKKRQLMRDSGIGDVEAFIAFQKGMAGYDLAHTVPNPATELPAANAWLDQALAIVPDIASALYLRTDLFGHILMEHATGEHAHEPGKLQAAVAEISSSLEKSARHARNEPLRAILEAESLIFTDDWHRIPDLLTDALKTGYCNPINWLSEFIQPFGYAKVLAENQLDTARCDPMAGWPVVAGGSGLIWDGRSDQAIDLTDAFLARAPFNPWVDDIRFLAKLTKEGWTDDPSMFGPTPQGSKLSFSRIVHAHAAAGDLEMAKTELDKWRAANDLNDEAMLAAAVIFGDHDEANRIAALIDSRAGGQLALSIFVSNCYCGAPFDLDATPNYKRGIEQAGFSWPPPSPIHYPAKDW